MKFKRVIVETSKRLVLFFCIGCLKLNVDWSGNQDSNLTQYLHKILKFCQIITRCFWKVIWGRQSSVEGDITKEEKDARFYPAVSDTQNHGITMHLPIIFRWNTFGCSNFDY
ncbi:hypothetical protein B1NLA3E_14995 [Bacillus sp. 1NLA3E]|nr:hypothetical protein B1NLA3E_14995 [Bacillus sp. 1NLA3E]